jgi:hypothetical protein
VPKTTTANSVVPEVKPVDTKASTLQVLTASTTTTANSVVPATKSVASKTSNVQTISVPESGTNNSVVQEVKTVENKALNGQTVELFPEIKSVNVTLPPQTSVLSASLFAIAAYNYNKDEANEISFRTGEMITDVVDVKGGWYRGTNSLGASGYFPGNYVKLILIPTSIQISKLSAEALVSFVYIIIM